MVKKVGKVLADECNFIIPKNRNESNWFFFGIKIQGVWTNILIVRPSYRSVCCSNLFEIIFVTQFFENAIIQ